MKVRRALTIALFMLFGTVAFAQETPKVEVPVDYSYMRFNPENSNVVGGFSLNGGGGGVAVYLNEWIGIQAEFEGYGSLTRTFNFPVGSHVCLTGCSVPTSASAFTYNVGPIIKYRAGHFEPFIETMFGGAHSNTYANFIHACALQCISFKNPSNNAFDFIIGGGLDIPVGHHIAIRPAQFDFVLTRFDSTFTNSNTNQSNFRYQAGVVFRF